MISPINDHCEAFDSAYAIWYWLSHHHEGMMSDKYAAMSISHDYNMTNIPDIDPDSEGIDDENYGAIERYHQITEDNWEVAVRQFRDFMDNKWDDE